MNNIIDSLSPRAVKALAVAAQNAALNHRDECAGAKPVYPSDLFAALLDEDDFCHIFKTTKAALAAMKTAYLEYNGRDGSAPPSVIQLNALLQENERLTSELGKALERLAEIHENTSGYHAGADGIAKG